MNESSASALAYSADYISGELIGSAATALAVLAVAVVGIMMLAGRLDSRRAVLAIVGCFLLFSARTIASGLLSVADQTVTQRDNTPLPLEVPPPSPAMPPSYDPYAGAAVPNEGKDLPGSPTLR